jgi:hypothetical protein
MLRAQDHFGEDCPTVHDAFHALMPSELDRRGTTTPELFEMLNLRLARSVTARNALGISEAANAREIARVLYGEVHPCGCFRFVTFGHTRPLIFSAERRQFIEVDKGRMAQFLALGRKSRRIIRIGSGISQCT